MFLCQKDKLNDKKRIIRALEIYYTTGKPMSYYYKDFRKRNNSYNAVIIGITMDRENYIKGLTKELKNDRGGINRRSKYAA